MRDASTYPISTPYGYVPGYPLNNGFHQGIDYACPMGTPVVVNGVTIGLSGNTGYSDGPHCHVGKWLNGVVQNPYNGGWKFKSAVVTEINEDVQNGKYVRVQGDGYSWVYLHLSNNTLVQVGHVLEEEPMFNDGDRKNLNVYFYGEDKGLFTEQVGKDWKSAMYNLFQSGSSFDFEFKVNDGDIKNINAATGDTTASGVKSQNWKKAYYGYFSKFFSTEFVPVDTILYEKKKG